MTQTSFYPRVKDVLLVYEVGGIEAIIEYYSTPGMIILSNSWHERIMKSAYDGRKISLSAELNVVIEKLKFIYKKYDEFDSIDKNIEQEINIHITK